MFIDIVNIQSSHCVTCPTLSIFNHVNPCPQTLHADEISLELWCDSAQHTASDGRTETETKVSGCIAISFSYTPCSFHIQRWWCIRSRPSWLRWQSGQPLGNRDAPSLVPHLLPATCHLTTLLPLVPAPGPFRVPQTWAFCRGCPAPKQPLSHWG